MRLFVVAILGLALSTPALAQTDNTATSSTGIGHAFGSANCPTRVVCPQDGNVATRQLLAIGNACITQYFGYSSANGFFEDMGTNSNNCLTSIPDTIPKGVGAQLAPLCCIIKMPDSSCLLHCDLVTTQ